MQRHRAGFGIEFQHIGETHIGAIALPSGGCTVFGIGSDISRSKHYGPIDVARNGVEGVDGLIGSGERIGGKQQSQVRTCRHGYCAYLLGVETTLLSLVAHHAHCTLGIFPRCLIDGETLGARGAIHQFHALYALAGEAFGPLVEQVDIATRLVRSARDKYHASICSHLLVGAGHPLNVSHAVLIGIVVGKGFFIVHHRHLMRLAMRHFAGGPHEFYVASIRGKRNQQAR